MNDKKCYGCRSKDVINFKSLKIEKLNRSFPHLMSTYIYRRFVTKDRFIFYSKPRWQSRVLLKKKSTKVYSKSLITSMKSSICYTICRTCKKIM